MAFLVCTSMSRAQSTWDVGTDFSGTANPNGEWTYGAYVPDALKAQGYPDFWCWSSSYLAETSNLKYYGLENDPGGAGWIIYNPNNSMYRFSNITTTQFFQPKTVAIQPCQPGQNGAFMPVVRWTAPRDMTVSIDSLFTGQDGDATRGATTDVHILLNSLMHDYGYGWYEYTGTSLFDGYVDGNIGNAEANIPQFGPSPSVAYQGEISVVTGDTIDFVVNFGYNDYSCDVTGLSATITEVPEPSTWVFLVTGLLCIIGWHKRK
jgi:hypothetical protein